MKKRHHQDDTTFISRTAAGAKKHVVSTVIASVIGVATSTVIPLIEQWHSDKQIASEISAAEERCDRKIEELKATQAKLWRAKSASEKALASHGIIVPD